MTKESTNQRSPDFLVTVLDPLLYQALENLCRNAIAYSGNCFGIRSDIINLRQHLQRVAEATVGYDTAEVVALQQLIKRTDPNASSRPDEPKQDPITSLHLLNRLDAEMVHNATVIRKIWQAFGRFLVSTGKDFSPLGGQKTNAKPLQPMDVMSSDTLNVWQDAYVPWLQEAREKRVLGTPISAAAITLRIVVEGYFPQELDAGIKKKWGSPPWRNGQCLRVLRQELSAFSAFVPV